MKNEISEKKINRVIFYSFQTGKNIEIRTAFPDRNVQVPYPWCITVKILKFGTLQTIAIIVLEKFDVTLH